jgi:hypothetical protein
MLFSVVMLVFSPVSSVVNTCSGSAIYPSFPATLHGASRPQKWSMGQSAQESPQKRIVGIVSLDLINPVLLVSPAHAPPRRWPKKIRKANTSLPFHHCIISVSLFPPYLKPA